MKQYYDILGGKSLEKPTQHSIMKTQLVMHIHKVASYLYPTRM